jgi:esterase
MFSTAAIRARTMSSLFIGILLISAVMFGLPVEAAPKWPLPDGIKSIEVNGYDMAYREAGSGAPLVMVHGAMSDYRSWTIQVPEFAQKYHVFAVSLRHHYPEKWNGSGGDYSVMQHADDVAAFIRKLNIGKVHLLGHSRGGSVVLQVASKNPKLIQTLILADASGLEGLLPDTPENQKLAAEANDLLKTLAKNLGTGDTDMAARVFVDALNGAGTWEKRTPEQKQPLLDNIATGTVAEQRPQMACDAVGRFDFPVFLMNGEQSPKRYPAVFTAMRHCTQAPEPLVIPNAAHNMHRDNPTAFNAAVLDFLARN